MDCHVIRSTAHSSQRRRPLTTPFDFVFACLRRQASHSVAINTIIVNVLDRHVIPLRLHFLAKTKNVRHKPPSSVFASEKAWDAFARLAQLFLPAFSCEQSAAGNKIASEWTASVRRESPVDFRKTLPALLQKERQGIQSLLRGSAAIHIVRVKTKTRGLADFLQLYILPDCAIMSVVNHLTRKEVEMKYVPQAQGPPNWWLTIEGDRKALKSSLKIILGWFNEQSISWLMADGKLEIKSSLKDPVIISAIINELQSQTIDDGRRVVVTIHSEVQNDSPKD